MIEVAEMEKIDVSIKDEIFKLIEEKAIKEQQSISSVCRVVIEEYYRRHGKEFQDDK